jgi:hypothetical protein
MPAEAGTHDKFPQLEWMLFVWRGAPASSALTVAVDFGLRRDDRRRGKIKA